MPTQSTADAQQGLLDAKPTDVASAKVQQRTTRQQQQQRAAQPDEAPTADAGTQDSVQTAFLRSQHLQHPSAPAVQQHHASQLQHAQQQQQLLQQQQQAQRRRQPGAPAQLPEDMDGCSSEVEGGPMADDRYIKGTRLIINGWFQACRGCNEPTAHTAPISRRDVPLCPRCQGKYNAMIQGCCPPAGVVSDPAIEPLHYWLPRLIGPVPPLSAEQRRDFCDALVLRQDDAWLQLINVS